MYNIQIFANLIPHEAQNPSVSRFNLHNFILLDKTGNAYTVLNTCF